MSYVSHVHTLGLKLKFSIHQFSQPELDLSFQDSVAWVNSKAPSSSRMSLDMFGNVAL
jgi:hypothetical protein